MFCRDTLLTTTTTKAIRPSRPMRANKLMRGTKARRRAAGRRRRGCVTRRTRGKGLQRGRRIELPKNQTQHPGNFRYKHYRDVRSDFSVILWVAVYALGKRQGDTRERRVPHGGNVQLVVIFRSHTRFSSTRWLDNDAAVPISLLSLLLQPSSSSLFHSLFPFVILSLPRSTAQLGIY